MVGALHADTIPSPAAPRKVSLDERRCIGFTGLGSISYFYHSMFVQAVSCVGLQRLSLSTNFIDIAPLK